MLFMNSNIFFLFFCFYNYISNWHLKHKDRVEWVGLFTSKFKFGNKLTSRLSDIKAISERELLRGYRELTDFVWPIYYYFFNTLIVLPTSAFACKPMSSCTTTHSQTVQPITIKCFFQWRLHNPIFLVQPHQTIHNNLVLNCLKNVKNNFFLIFVVSEPAYAYLD